MSDEVPQWAAHMDVSDYVDANTAGVKAMIRARETATAVDDIVTAVMPWVLADLRAKVEALPSERVNGRDCYWAEDIFDLIDDGGDDR